MGPPDQPVRDEAEPAPPSDTPIGAEASARVSLPIRGIFAVIGTISLAFGIIGIFVPVLPTTPFVLLAAACYARASPRLYGWLLGQPALGPIVTDWRRSRSLPPGVRVRALVLVVLTFAASIALVDELLVRAALVVTGAVLILFLARIPTSR